MTEGKTSRRSRSARHQVVELPVRLDIAAAAELKRRLDTALNASHPLTLDAHAVEHVDAAGLQLLLAFQRADPPGTGAEWRNPSAMLREAAALLGLSEALRLDAHAGSPAPIPAS